MSATLIADPARQQWGDPRHVLQGLPGGFFIAFDKCYACGAGVEDEHSVNVIASAEQAALDASGFIACNDNQCD
jgi:hypothetical protein